MCRIAAHSASGEISCKRMADAKLGLEIIHANRSDMTGTQSRPVYQIQAAAGMATKESHLKNFLAQPCSSQF